MPAEVRATRGTSRKNSPNNFRRFEALSRVPRQERHEGPNSPSSPPYRFTSQPSYPKLDRSYRSMLTFWGGARGPPRKQPLEECKSESKYLPSSSRSVPALSRWPTLNATLRSASQCHTTPPLKYYKKYPPLPLRTSRRRPTLPCNAFKPCLPELSTNQS